MSKQELPVVDLTAVACCSPLAVRPMDAEQAAVVAPLFKALGDPIRLRLMSMIASVPEMCVCDLTPAFDLSGPTISHHLKVLREAGLVDSERRGTWVWYRVKPETFRQLGALLDISAAPAVSSTA
ncbi:ArsR/SmtB family transcription factor [Micromonospora taraxaci]|uniref:ArsR/SmtB family transcription factor n=1 Tax=Micromonospora taraxaci TaxID=1316803 RepID=UPI0034067DC3